MRTFDQCPHLESLVGVYQCARVTRDEAGRRVRTPGSFHPHPDGLIKQCTACHGLQWIITQRWYESITELLDDT